MKKIRFVLVLFFTLLLIGCDKEGYGDVMFYNDTDKKLETVTLYDKHHTPVEMIAFPRAECHFSDVETGKYCIDVYSEGKYYTCSFFYLNVDEYEVCMFSDFYLK